MDTEAGEEIQPVADKDLPSKELQERFDSLFDEAYELFSANDADTIEAASEALCDRTRIEVEEFPILARTISNDMLSWSLLTTLCEKTCHSDICHEAIKFLITMNPHALLWGWGEKSCPSYLIQSIAKDLCHCVLLPWIAQHYPWIFDHPKIRRQPPHLNLVKHCSNRVCEAEVVRTFFEHYPAGLAQDDKFMKDGLPLHRCVDGWEECDAELFEWMAKQYPNAMEYRDRLGMTVLHTACMELSSTVEEGVAAPSKCTESTARICRFLVSDCPQLVRVKAESGDGLPIHWLAHRCNRPLVQEIVVLLLKEYPESVEIKAPSRLPKLSSVPFIQEIGALVQQEKDIQEEHAWLKQATTNFLAFARDGCCVQIGEVFAGWATHRTQVGFRDQQEHIEKQMAQVRNHFQGDDVNDDREEDEENEDEGDLEEVSSEGEYSEDDDLNNDESDDDESQSDGDESDDGNPMYLSKS